MYRLSDYIPRTEDIVKFNSLVKLINTNSCVAFVGAGVSVNKGYRSWNNLIYDQSIIGSPRGLLEAAGVPSKEIKHLKTYSQIMDYCKARMGRNDFVDFIKIEYARKSSEISENHALICKTNFTHIITTNFDPCLYDNAESLIPEIPDLKTFGANPLEFNEHKTLFHLHGRAFIIENEDDLKLNNLIDSLVFGELSFNEAYVDGFEISSFLYRVMQKFKLFFIGYSMNDEVFNNTTTVITKAYIKFLKDFTKLNSLKEINPILGFILLAYPLEAYEKLNSKASGLEEKEKNKLLQQIENFKSEEKRLMDMGLQVIAYNKIDNNFNGLTAVLQLIKNDAAMVSLSKPFETPDATIVASITGSLL